MRRFDKEINQRGVAQRYRNKKNFFSPAENEEEEKFLKTSINLDHI